MFLASRSFHYQFLQHLQYWKWTGGDGKENTHTNIGHTHQMDSSDNKGDFNPWQAELRCVPTSDENSFSDTYWQMQRGSSLWKVPDTRSSFQSDQQVLHKIIQICFMSCLFEKKNICFIFSNKENSNKNTQIHLPILNITQNSRTMSQVDAMFCYSEL